MNELKIFDNEDFGEVRIIIENNIEWFNANDVCKALEYKNSREALRKHVDSDDVTKRDTILNTGLGDYKGEINYINESGLYSLIFGSKLEKAKKFKKWITSEVLPSIRKHGAYATDELLNDPDLFIKVLTDLKKEREEKKLLQDKALEDKPKVLFAEAVTTSKTSILVGELAKLLKQNGIDIGQNRLFKWLRDKGYLISKNSISYNMPTQKSMNLELFEIKETSITHSDGHITVSKTPKVTGKGQVYFINKFLEGDAS